MASLAPQSSASLAFAAEEVPSSTAQTYALPDVAVVDRIEDIGRDAWNGCFPNALEDYDYLLALEHANIPHFTRHYVTVRQHGMVAAAAPAFITRYAIETTFDDGALRRAIRAIRRYWPKFLTMRLACLGGAEIESGRIGFHPSIAAAQQADLLRSMLAAFEGFARAQKCPLIAAKDVPSDQEILWQNAATHYTALAGMATACLPIDFTTIDEYFARLSKETRKDMRRKLKSEPNIRVLKCTNVEDVSATLIALYRQTRERSDYQFEELTEGYFREVLARLPGRAFCNLYYDGAELIGANLMLQDATTLLDKFFFMDAAKGREHNLYFLSWFHNIRTCLEHGLRLYQSGQAGEGTKLRLGSTLHANGFRFRHSNPALNRLLVAVGHRLSMQEITHDQ